MNVLNNNAHVAALSDQELDAVSGGERHEVSKETYEKLLWVRYVVSGSKK